MKIGKKFFSKGFTLVELMAAMAITVVLIVVIVAMTNRGTQIWRWVVQDVRTTNLAQTAIQVMTKDMESMQVREGNPFEWAIFERDSDLESPSGRVARGKSAGTVSKSRARKSTRKGSQMLMGPKDAEITNASQLIFFATPTDRNPAKSSMNPERERIMGDINCIGYKLLYRDQILDIDPTSNSEGFPVYALYRQVIPALETYRELLGREDLKAAYERYAREETRPENFLVENIIQMTMVFDIEYQKRQGTADNPNSNALKQIEPIPLIATGNPTVGAYREIAVYGNRLNVFSTGSQRQDMVFGKIVGVQISMTIVTDEGMNVVDQIRTGERPSMNREIFFRDYTRSFAQRVTLPLF